MAGFLLLPLVLHIQLGFILGSSPGLDGRSAQQREKVDRYEKQPIYNRHQSPNPSNAARSSKSGGGSPHQQHDSLPTPIWAFLHTGDPSKLGYANCTKRYQLSNLKEASDAVNIHPSLHSAMDTVVHATNFLNMILQTNGVRELTIKEDIEWYHALVRSILEGDPKVHRAVVTFDVQPFTSPPQLFLQATRIDNQIFLQDLSAGARHLANHSIETEWFNRLKQQRSPESYLHRKLLRDELKSVHSSMRKRGMRYLVDKTHIKWSAPYLECEHGKYKPLWLLTLSTSFYGLKPDFKPEFRGVVRVDINLQNVDIDQCSTEGWFGGTHKCRLNSTKCISPKGRGFMLGAYDCSCKPGFYRPGGVSLKSFDGKGPVHHRQGTGQELSEESRMCLPCRNGCSSCQDDSPCHAEKDKHLRIAIIAFQTFCMLLDFIAMLVVYHFHRCKSIRASGLVLLETILFGALLLYFPVVILYFEPSIFRCILLRWVRLLGFSIVYGTVTLKLYRVLKVFLSRTAQRVPYMTSWRVVRMLGIILLIVCWFLISWTSAVCENLDRNVSLIVQGQTADGLKFNMCLLDRWDYMMAIAEFLFLLWGVFLCYAVRTVPSAFHEPRYMAVAVHNELIISAVFHTIRFTLASSLHNDWMLMLFFVHTHLTVTVTLCLLLIPKFLQASINPRDDIATEAYEDELDMGRSGSYLNSSITSAWSEHSLDPDDIRDELKKLYAQLEIYKRKMMTANNPHLQKKRSSKKGLGRSIMRRITEIPETVSRQCSKEDKEHSELSIARNSITIGRRNPFDPTSSSVKTKEDFMKNKALLLQKSLSSYDHMRDQGEDSNISVADKMEVSSTEAGLVDSLMGKKLSKKTHEKGDSISTESVPLVCKSASAHNLSVDKKPLHPRTSMLQKSLSVIASAKEKTLGMTGKAQSMDDHTKHYKGQQRGKDTNKSHPSADNNEMGASQPKNSLSHSSISEEAKKAPKAGIMKQHINSQSTIIPDTANSRLSDPFDRAEVCPWELQDQSPTPSESRVQKHVSIAPVESQNIHSSHSNVKAQNTNKHKSGENIAKQKQATQGNIEKSEVCPWDFEEPQSSLPEGRKPITQQPDTISIAKDMDSNNVAKVFEIHPWDFKEMPSKTLEKSQIVKGDGNKGEKTDGKDKEITPETLTSSCSLQQVNRANVCPWEFEPSESPESEKSLASAASTSLLNSIPQKKSMMKGFGISVKTLVSAGKGKEAEKAKERKDDKVKAKGKYKEKDMKDENLVDKSNVAESSPWEVKVTPGSATGKSKKINNNGAGKERGKLAEKCPWEAEDSSPILQVAEGDTVAAKDNKNSHGIDVDTSKMASICPWDFDDQTSGKNV
ncbi:probable G-protein coupled receptor 158 [Carcharodon carcharias]|uniref:probable G-protein coupled receptor 158 n=1 Tax=Carcharodon carcharias TaxID=13397 RepID=UPI001B7F5EFA|nr:probable G-protein coupled receptor 158 [Carcharodon carcharias]